MSEMQRKEIITARPMARIMFYHSTIHRIIDACGGDLRHCAVLAGVSVIWNLGNRTTDLYAYPGPASMGVHSSVEAIVRDVIAEGYRVVSYAQMIKDFDALHDFGVPLPSIYHHRTRAQPIELIRRVIRPWPST